MSRKGYGELIELARSRYGVATDLEAELCGVSADRLGRLVSSGAFLRPQPGVIIAGAAPRTWEQDVAVAVLSAGHGGAASHMSAAALWGMLNTSGGRVEVTVPRWDRTHRQFTIHESLDLVAEDVTELSGITITSPARTVVDLGAVFPSAVLEAYNRGNRAGLLDLAAVVAVVNRVGKRGRQGTGPARELVRNKRLHPDRTESHAEDLYLNISRTAGLSEPVQQLEIRDEQGWFICRADFAYPDSSLVVFIDGLAYHGDQVAFQRDRTQGNLLELIGWRYLRFTFRDLVDHPLSVVDQVRRALSLSILA